MPVDQLAKITPLRRRGRRRDPPLSQARRQALGDAEGPRAPRRAGARRRAAQPLRRARAGARATRSRPTATGSSSSRRRFPWHGDAPTSARRSRRSRPTWSAPQPMDRLICGDVGYGKTEVALRAAFKAAERRQAGARAGADDDPRPAALRHVRRAAAATTRSRSSSVSRFRSAAEQREVVAASTRARSTSSSARTALLGRDVRAEGPRPADRRRGAALRRQAEGAAAPAEAARST